MRDRAADGFHLAQHRLLVDRLDLRLVLGDAEGRDHRIGGGQGHLEAHVGRQLARGLGLFELGVGGHRLARVAELGKPQLGGVHAIRQPDVGEEDDRLAGLGRHGLQVGIGAQQRKLPGDPHPPTAGLAVRNPLQPVPEQPAQGLEGLRHGVDADGSDQVDVFGQALGFGHGELPLEMGAERPRSVRRRARRLDISLRNATTLVKPRRRRSAALYRQGRGDR